jgi:ABC-type uncharacterized transport system involved in gliding motility auxiliary subunit
MFHSPRKKWELRAINASFVLLFLVAVGLLQWLSREFPLQFDLTANSRHSLSEASQAAARGLAAPLTVTAYASQRGQLRRVIGEFIARYQKYKADIRLEFIDPDAAPEQARAAGIQADGELVLEYAGAHESLPPAQLNEEAFTNLLTRLGHRGERWIVFLAGHGERSPDRQANFDLSLWATQLRARGFKLRTLVLGEHPQIPQNTTTLVLAGPRARLLPGEVKEIETYLERGGNLLWLADPGALHGLEPVAERLGLEFLPGVIVDPRSQALTGNPAALVIASYGTHPIVRHFSNITLFPRAGGLQVNGPEGWETAVVLDTREGAWAETGPLGGKLAFDKGRDIRGPLNLAVALTRQVNDRAQRVVVVGNGEFLANTFLGNGGNLDLGMSLVNWLSQDDAYVSIPVRTARDRSLTLSRAAQAGIAGVFLLALPLAFIAGGVIVWLRRRKR